MSDETVSFSQVAGRPRLSESTVRRILRDDFGIDGDLARLPSERDQNFQVLVDGAPRYVAKISNTAEDPEVIDLQHKAMEHLFAAGIGCPVPVPAVDGRSMRTVNGYLFRVLTFLSGDLLAQRTVRQPELLTQFGAFLGHVSTAFADFGHPAAERHLQWDVARAADVISHYLPGVPSHRRPLLERALHTFTTQLAPMLPELPHSVIHNDANDHNVVIEGDHTIVGLIDFGDMVHSITLNELAVGCAYAALGQPDPTAVIGVVADGYATGATLSEDERRLLPELVKTRLATSVAISAHQHSIDPSDAYLTVSEEHAWRTLALLDATPHR